MIGPNHHLDYHLVALSSILVGVIKGVPEGMVSLAVGLVGVALARWVFVNREFRATNRQQSWRETLPLTLVAMLVAGVLIWDRKFSVSTSAFIGLGVGWTAVLLLDVFGDYVLTKMRLMFQAGPANPNLPKAADASGHDGRLISDDVAIPEDMRRTLAEIERKTQPKILSPGIPKRKRGRRRGPGRFQKPRDGGKDSR